MATVAQQNNRANAIVNVTSFGAAVNDLRSNSRLAFQSALRALDARGGGILYVPRGDYLIDFPDISDNVDPRLPENHQEMNVKRLAKEKLILVPSNVIIEGETDRAGNYLTHIHWKATSFP